jgi:hypothetical protein
VEFRARLLVLFIVLDHHHCLIDTGEVTHDHSSHTISALIVVGSKVMVGKICIIISIVELIPIDTTQSIITLDIGIVLIHLIISIAWVIAIDLSKQSICYRLVGVLTSEVKIDNKVSGIGSFRAICSSTASLITPPNSKADRCFSLDSPCIWCAFSSEQWLRSSEPDISKSYI